MPAEHSQPSEITRITIDLKERSVTFASDEADLGVLPFQAIGVLAQGLATAFGPQRAVTIRETPSVSVDEEQPAEERSKTITATGKLKTDPKSGKPDRRGNPTTYATFIAHDEEADTSHPYLATFHRATAAVSRLLKAGDRITVAGYPHEAKGGQKMDTLSVFQLIDYPNKPTRRNEA